MITVDLLMYMSDGQVVYTMHVLQIQACTERGRAIPSLQTLKGRWRCLLKRLDVEVCDAPETVAPETVAACCVLHNVCEIHGDAFKCY